MAEPSEPIVVDDEQQVQLTEPSPEETPAPAASPPPADGVAELREMVSSLQRELADSRAQAQAAYQFGAAAFERTNQAETRPAETAPPQPPPVPRLSDAEREMYTDPDAMERYVHQSANWHAKRAYDHTMSQLAPVLQKLVQAANGWETIRPAVVETAYGSAIANARQAMETQGLPADQFDALLPDVRQALWNASRGDAAPYDAMMANPTALIGAAAMLRIGRQMPIAAPQKPPPTIGSTPSSKTPPNNKAGLGRLEAAGLNWMGSKLGIEKWDPTIIGDLRFDDGGVQ